MGAAKIALPEQPQVTTRTSLLEIAIFFLRLGTTAFGGPAAQIAIMEDEFVRRRYARRDPCRRGGGWLVESSDSGARKAV